MTKAILFYRKSLLTKLFMLVMLLVGGGNYVWGSTVVFDGSKNTLNWTLTNGNGGSQSYSSGDINSWGTTGSGLRVFTSPDNLSISSGQYILINAKKYSSGSTGAYISIYFSSNNGTNYSVPTTFTVDNGIGNNYENLSNVVIPDNTNKIKIECGLVYVHSITIETPSQPAPSAFSATPSYVSATLDWTAGGTETKWQIKYNADEDFNPENGGTMASDNPVTTNPYTLSGLEEGTKYYAYIRAYTDNTTYSDWVALEDSYFITTEQYPKPRSFALGDFTISTATFSWTKGSDETAWQIAYSTKSDFNPDTEGAKIDINENPYTLTELIDNVTYYAYVRSNYSGNYSAWSNLVEFTLNGVNDFNTSESMATSNYVPIYGNQVEAGTQSQIIIPSSELTGLVDRYITKLTFYTNTASSKPSSISWGDATFEVYLDKVTTEKYSSSDKKYEAWGTKVFDEAKLFVSNYKMEIEFDTPFKYTGDNLMIGFKQIATGTNAPVEWIAVSRTWGNNYGIYTYGSTTSTVYVVPKVTITTKSSSIPVTLGTNGYTTFACPRPLDLANLPSGLKAYKAAVDAENNKVRFTEIGQTVPANTGMLLEGTANEEYDIPVADAGITLAENDFLVNSVGGTFTAEDGYTYFGLLKNSGPNPLVFGVFAPGSVAIPSNKAYLKVENDPSGEARQLVCSFDDETPTGISATLNDKEKTINDEFIYNLNGQRVNKPSKGLYIVNGKKVIIK